MSIKEYLYTKVIPRRIILKWERYKEGHLIFKCLPEKHFYDNGSFAFLMDRQKYSSQYGQDYYLDRIVFGGKKEGFFLDIGANHPTELSNSLYFENCGWNGLAFEPQKKLCELWKEKRRCECLNVALGPEDKTISFVESDDKNGICSRVISEGERSVEKAYTIEQRRLQTVLDQYNITDIDFVSIDVEGYEYQVLEGIDFDKCNIRCILIENNKENEYPDMKLREYIMNKGYRFLGRIVIDDIYVKENE